MAGKIKVLLAEDEMALGTIVKESLETRNFNVIWCENGKTALDAYQNHFPDILVLDIMMPIKDGLSLAKEIRKQDQNTPILFLTSKSQPRDVVLGFESGGNDYIRKPFSIEELIVRINELVDRKSRRDSLEEVAIGKYQFNYARQKLEIEDEAYQLTYRESEVLMRLARSPNMLIDRSVFLNEIWGEDDFFNARSMDVFISKLRKKLSRDPDIEILNVRGYGYKLVC